MEELSENGRTTVVGSATHRSPLSKPVTFLPVSTTSPTTSWPGISCKRQSKSSGRTLQAIERGAYRELRDEFALMYVTIGTTDPCTRSSTEKCGRWLRRYSPHALTDEVLKTVSYVNGCSGRRSPTFQENLIVSDLRNRYLADIKLASLLASIPGCDTQLARLQICVPSCTKPLA